jgi:hypothetical protein
MAAFSRGRRGRLVSQILVSQTKGAPTEADALLDNERPATTYLISDGPPAVTGSPCGTGEAPALNPPSGASPYAQSVRQKAALTLRSKGCTDTAVKKRKRTSADIGRAGGPLVALFLLSSMSVKVRSALSRLTAVCAS